MSTNHYKCLLIGALAGAGAYHLYLNRKGGGG